MVGSLFLFTLLYYTLFCLGYDGGFQLSILQLLCFLSGSPSCVVYAPAFLLYTTWVRVQSILLHSAHIVFDQLLYL